MGEKGSGVSSELSIVFAGGGSAGHVSPLLAMARAVRRMHPDARITVVGTEEGLESRLVPDAGFELELIPKAPMPRRLNKAALQFPRKYLDAGRRAAEILRRVDADVVVGVGGYVCPPMYKAAFKAKVPVVIHEANIRAGMANKMGAKKAAFVGTAFAETKIADARHVGMPMREAIANLDRAGGAAEARRGFGLDPEAPTLLVTGGSLGAVNLNRALAGAVEELTRRGVQVLHITGVGKGIEAQGATDGAAYVQLAYVDAMERAYEAADVIVCRAGAGTVSEVAAAGLPGILVPLPVGNGEQALNGKVLVDAHAALMVEDAELTSGWLIENVMALFDDPVRLERMGIAAATVGITDAAQTMARTIVDIASQHASQRSSQ
ncbi:UDP-N-acetylglucosamine--N-acetylmuramyl-(pentapeptide) pyrophosphoryl-undecaprenol N-acetylglucosamine transferase [Arthrobacter sp. HMSC06H05]|nr:UDP-N-acetylglucosamine--N-acetylmuramyl-(pentapeptide) pyrophosphoryl-undecaprenol N-acetylglucosamine transferase [Arthrobacter sp. HMSC08H08]OFT43246.1 UDP-N-acetylglucosamine--N-acetylmuramyl-(pentapeptide) pyrophosphoryl-undecaprenol N-acetylglucosamine transferase [Arthrobacter sp. HMSC06H05]